MFTSKFSMKKLKLSNTHDIVNKRIIQQIIIKERKTLLY